MSKDEIITFIQNHGSKKDILSFAIKINHASNPKDKNSTSSTQTKDSSNDRVAAADILLNISARLESPTNPINESLDETRNDEMLEHRTEHNISTNIYEDEVIEQSFLDSFMTEDFPIKYVKNVNISGTSNHTSTLAEERFTNEDHNIKETAEKIQKQNELNTKGVKDANDIMSKTSTLKQPETMAIEATSTEKNIDNQDKNKFTKERNKKNA